MLRHEISMIECSLRRNARRDAAGWSTPIARFCPAESFVGSASPGFDRRGAHRAWNLATCFNLPLSGRRCAPGSLMPKTTESAPGASGAQPASGAARAWSLVPSLVERAQAAAIAPGRTEFRAARFCRRIIVPRSR